MSSKRTWLLAKVYCQFEAKFRTLMIEETLSAAKFRFEAKIQRKSALCSNEMSLKRPRTFDRIFVRTFDERSLEQITKYSEFRLHYFAQYCKYQATNTMQVLPIQFVYLYKVRGDWWLITPYFIGLKISRTFGWFLRIFAGASYKKLVLRIKLHHWLLWCKRQFYVHMGFWHVLIYTLSKYHSKGKITMRTLERMINFCSWPLFNKLS